MRWLGLSVGLLLLVGHLVHGQPPTAEQRQATVKFVESLEKKTGGFAADAKPDSPATLPATASALRALRCFGGDAGDRLRSSTFLSGCYDKTLGAYRATPEGRADIRSTAVGLLALTEELALRDAGSLVPRKETWAYLANEAKTFEDIRIAAAAYEAWQPRSRDRLPQVTRQQWLAEVHKLRNPDGTYGTHGNLARDTASCVVTLLRLEQKLDDAQRKEVVKVLKSGQRADGGWGKEGAKSSDLETTYRVMRCFHMLKEKPEVAACQAFIAKCRNEDGSYSVEPGQPGNVSATYFAGIVLHWLGEMK